MGASWSEGGAEGADGVPVDIPVPGSRRSEGQGLQWSWIDSMRSESIAGAVNGLKHHSDIAVLVWDGARGHRAELVEGIGLPTIVQPPYSQSSILLSVCSKRSVAGWREGCTRVWKRRWRRLIPTCVSWSMILVAYAR